MSHLPQCVCVCVVTEWALSKNRSPIFCQNTWNDKHFPHSSGEGLLVANGDRWARSRRLLTSAFHFDILRPYALVFADSANLLVVSTHTHTHTHTYNYCTLQSSCTHTHTHLHTHACTLSLSHSLSHTHHRIFGLRFQRENHLTSSQTSV